MASKQTDSTRILRELLESLARAQSLTDVNIAAGIALNELDGVEDAAA